MKIDSKWKAVAMRLAQEFWLPALIGCVWCWIEWDAMDSSQSTFKQAFKNFAAGLFFGSFFIGNIVRVARQQFTEGKLLSHSQKLDSLSTKLKAQTDEFISWITGGKSQLVFECTASDSYFSAKFRHEGNIPIYDLDIEVYWGHATMPDVGSAFMVGSNEQPIKRKSWQTVFPGTSQSFFIKS